jgi:hypothetical protein
MDEKHRPRLCFASQHLSTLPLRAQSHQSSKREQMLTRWSKTQQKEPQERIQSLFHRCAKIKPRPAHPTLRRNGQGQSPGLEPTQTTDSALPCPSKCFLLSGFSMAPRALWVWLKASVDLCPSFRHQKTCCQTIRSSHRSSVLAGMSSVGNLSSWHAPMVSMISIKHDRVQKCRAPLASIEIVSRLTIEVKEVGGQTWLHAGGHRL